MIRSKAVVKSMAPIKIVFKKHKRSTGLAAIGEGDYVDLKIKGKKFGTISGGSSFRRTYSIQFAHKQATENCDWSWLFIGRNYGTLGEAKEVAKASIDAFMKNYIIHFFEE